MLNVSVLTNCRQSYIYIYICKTYVYKLNISNLEAHIFYNLVFSFVVVGKSEGKRPLGRPMLGWEDNIEMDHQKVGWGAWTGLI